MNIGEASKKSGVSAKMIRHYEAIGLIGEVPRSGAGYRHYTLPDIDMLRFIRRSRDLGFSIENIRLLLSLWNERDRTSADVKELATRHLHALEEKIASLQQMRNTLSHLINDCSGDASPDCAILDDLARWPASQCAAHDGYSEKNR